MTRAWSGAHTHKAFQSFKRLSSQVQRLPEDKRSKRQREADEWGIGIIMIFFGWAVVDSSKYYIMVYPGYGHAALASFGYFLIAIGVGILTYKTWTAFKGRTLRGFSVKKFTGCLVGGIVLFFIVDILDFLDAGARVGFWRLAFREVANGKRAHTTPSFANTLSLCARISLLCPDADV